MTNTPENKFRAGAISATVWLNKAISMRQGEDTSEEISYRTISLQRGYKDKDGQWRNTNSLRINDIPRAILVLQKVYDYLVTTPVDKTPRQEPEVFEQELVM